MEINPPVQPVKPVSVTPATSPQTPTENKPGSSQPVEKSSRTISPYLLMLILFMVGLGLGYAMTKVFPGNKKTNPVQPKITVSKAIEVPKDATLVQSCVSHKGALYAIPKDLPEGPIYLVDQNKVIGLEYSLSQEEFIKRNNADFSSTLNFQADHIIISNQPEQIVDIYLISTKEAQKISCPEISPSPAPVTASPSAEVIPSEGLIPSVLVQPSPLLQPTTPDVPSPAI